MKKKIIISAFSALILITASIFIKIAIDSYNYDMDPANGVDLLEGFGAVLIMIFGGFAVFYELDLFYTVYCFFIKQRTKAKSILNVFANLSLLMVIVYSYLVEIFMELRVFELTPVILFFVLYVVLRIAYIIVSKISSIKETKTKPESEQG